MFHSFLIKKSYLNKNNIDVNKLILNNNLLQTNLNLPKNLDKFHFRKNLQIDFIYPESKDKETQCDINIINEIDFTFPQSKDKETQCDTNLTNEIVTTSKKETVDIGIQCNIDRYEDFEIVDKSGIPRSSFLAVGNYLYNNNSNE